jgi:peroxidase
LANPQWGSTDEALIRKSVAEYGDGISSPAGSDRPSPREISNLIADHSEEATTQDVLIATGDIILRDINFALNRRS